MGAGCNTKVNHWPADGLALAERYRLPQHQLKNHWEGYVGDRNIQDNAPSANVQNAPNSVFTSIAKNLGNLRIVN